jgi:segregation and condensation protein A
MEEEFKIKAGEFEGPLGLLLDLIEQRKLHVSQVSLAKVTDDYIGFLKTKTDIPMGEMANFILVASTLMLIKSVSLLPTLSVTPEEKTSIEDLERRLKALEQIRTLSQGVKTQFGRQIMFEKSERRLEPIFTPSPELKTGNWLDLLKKVLNAIPKIEKIPETVVKKVMSLEEMIDKLAARVTSAFKLKFSEFIADHKEERVSVIVSFLGMLELVKQGVIEVRQDDHFNDIHMETRATGVPRYTN